MNGLGSENLNKNSFEAPGDALGTLAKGLPGFAGLASLLVLPVLPLLHLPAQGSEDFNLNVLGSEKLILKSFEAPRARLPGLASGAPRVLFGTPARPRFQS